MTRFITEGIVKYAEDNNIKFKLDSKTGIVTLDSNNVSARISKESDSLHTIISSKDGKTIDEYSIKMESNNALLQSMSIFKAISESIITNSNCTKDGCEEECSDENILNEEDTDPTDDTTLDDITDIPSGLRVLYAEAKRLGDKLRKLSTMSDDVDMVTVIMDLANSAYGIAIDIEDANQTYIDLLQDEADEK